jgi:hypothetical protein
LVASGEDKGEYVEPDGGITDGDDGEWSGDKSILEGGGGWEGLVRGKKSDLPRLGKRARQYSPSESSPNSDKRRRTAEAAEPEFIDLTRSSSPIAYGSDDEADVSTFNSPVDFRFLAYHVSLA